MSQTNQQKLMEWHSKFGVPVETSPTIPSESIRGLRFSLIEEELAEFKAASDAQNIVEVADAIADLLYVVYGAAVAWGIDAQACFDEVHRSNMTKVWPDGTVHRRFDGKVLKPPGFQKPSLAEICKPKESIA